MEVTTVAKHSIDLLELVRKEPPNADTDFVREALGTLVGAIMGRR